MRQGLRYVLLICLSLGITSCTEEFDGRKTIAETAAMNALDSGGTAYVASVQDAQLSALTLLTQAIQREVLIDPKTLLFDGSADGTSGTATWSGEIGPTENLDLEYVISFNQYRGTPDGATISGEFAVSVSEGDIDCSGTWNFNGLNIVDLTGDFSMSSRGSGIVLQGPNCEDMDLDGAVDISGDSNASDCSVGGDVAFPDVDC